MDKYKFGEYIYKKRKKLGLTQDELGKMLGVTNKAVSKWEVGETMPDVTMLKSLANALGVTVDELLSQEDKICETVVENKLEEKPNKKNIYLIIIGILAIVIIVLLSFYINAIIKDNNKGIDGIKQIIISNENIKEIIDINPSSKIVCDEETLIIDSTYKLNERYSFDEKVSISFTVVYQYIYYYYLKDGSVGVVTYYNRFYDVVLNEQNKEESISVLLEPKFNIEEFKGFNQVKISYIVLNAGGSVCKNETDK